MANLKQLSEKLGLSQTTVSRALNGYSDVSETTRKRVQTAARKMNYHPNSSAQRLATGRSCTIGHVVPLGRHDMMNPHFADFLAGAGEAYNERGYNMLISVVDSAEQEQTYRTLKRNGSVDGVIVHAPEANDPRIAMLTELEMPFVVHGRTYHDDSSYNWVDVNNKRAFETATKHLLDLGHEHIALINGLEHMVFAHKRREGFEAALQSAGLQADDALMFSDEMIEPTAYRAVRHFMRAPNPPTAILCASMLCALGAQRALYELDLKPGRDVAILAFDDCLSCLSADMSTMPMTVMRSSIREHGALCANLVIDLCERKPTKPSHLLEAEFVRGTSTGPVRTT